MQQTNGKWVSGEGLQKKEKKSYSEVGSYGKKRNAFNESGKLGYSWEIQLDGKRKTMDRTSQHVYQGQT